MEPILTEIGAVVENAERQARRPRPRRGHARRLRRHRREEPAPGRRHHVFDPSVRSVLRNQPEWSAVIDRQLALLAGAGSAASGGINAAVVMTGLAGAASTAPPRSRRRHPARPTGRRSVAERWGCPSPRHIAEPQQYSYGVPCHPRSAHAPPSSPAVPPESVPPSCIGSTSRRLPRCHPRHLACRRQARRTPSTSPIARRSTPPWRTSDREIRPSHHSGQRRRSRRVRPISDDAGYVTGQIIGVNGGRNT